MKSNKKTFVSLWKLPRPQPPPQTPVSTFAKRGDSGLEAVFGVVAVVTCPPMAAGFLTQLQVYTKESAAYLSIA